MSSPGAKAAMGRLLLICNDSKIIEQVAEGTKIFAIATEVCGQVNMALPLVSRQKFEAIMIDVGLGQAGDILEQIRLSPSNRTAVTFAITDPKKVFTTRDSTQFCDGETAFGEFGRAHLESSIRVDRA